MTDAIRDELQTRRGRTKVAMDVHGQEGAQPGTAAGAPTDEELRSAPEEIGHQLGAPLAHGDGGADMDMDNEV